MTDPIVTHADLHAIKMLEGQNSVTSTEAVLTLLRRLRAAAEADRQVIDEPTWRGAVVKDRRGVEWVRVTNPGVARAAWFNSNGTVSASWGEVEGVELVPPPNARPTVTEGADVEKAARAARAAYFDGPDRWDTALRGDRDDWMKTVRATLDALGIEVTP